MILDPDDHAKACIHHQASSSIFCHAITNGGTTCKFRGHDHEPGYFPVCKMRRRHLIKIGKCQAIEVCGQPCNRPSKSAGLHYLCAKHYGCSDKLPCYLTKIPTELRLMIFRYLFPKVVQAAGGPNIETAILKTCRQLNQEASSVFYGETLFEAQINRWGLFLQGKIWSHWYKVDGTRSGCFIATLPHQSSAGLIQKLHVTIVVEISHSDVPERYTDRIKGIDSHNIFPVDYELYKSRDIVRKLVEYLQPAGNHLSSAPRKALKRLKVSTLTKEGFFWGYDEAALFLVLDPDRSNSVRLGPESQNDNRWWYELEGEWLESMNGQPSTTSTPIQEPSEDVKRGYQKIEKFSQIIYAQISGQSAWIKKAFDHLERPLHLARVAYENDDSDMIKKIHKAIKFRWVYGNRKQQNSLRSIEDSINAMFEDQNEDEDGGEEELGGRPVGHCKIIDDSNPSIDPAIWAELNPTDTAPLPSEPGVTIKFENMRVYINRDGEQWVRLMTPKWAGVMHFQEWRATMRQLKAEAADEVGGSDFEVENEMEE
ncbi:hypothetical protein GQ44DRAFT_668315 [Phaeosphaeriaceae sp. PMI808]|nr:hypothetical protein GQ44DRAFT_668315 [Phaeosphaeriaceae sp. PMI808]